MIEPEAAGQDRHDLIEALRSLRRASGLTGQRLAVRAHMSQSKISRIETGNVIPSAIDVERILQALDVSPSQVAELRALAKSANTELIRGRRSRRRGLQHRQREIAAIETKSTEIRYALPVMLTGLLQVGDYLSRTSRDRLREPSDEERAMIVAHRVDRQQALDNSQKHFTFLLAEAALRNMLAPSPSMVEQLENLLSLSERPNVDIEVIPFGRLVTWIPLSVFVIYDDRMVTIETDGGMVVLRDPTDVQEHLELFEHFREGALKDDECRDLLRSIAEEFRRLAD